MCPHNRRFSNRGVKSNSNNSGSDMSGNTAVPPDRPRCNKGPSSIKEGRDLFGRQGQAKSYAAARPRYPAAAIAYVVEGISGATVAEAGASEAPGSVRSPALGGTYANTLCIDVATGTGQLAVPLGAHFRRVIGCDISTEQLAHATPAPNVEYVHATAYDLPAADNSVDLVTVGQALHWLDAEAFFREAARCLRPGGTLAVLGYGMCSLAAAGPVDNMRDSPVRGGGGVAGAQLDAQARGDADASTAATKVLSNLWDSFYFQTLGSHSAGRPGDPCNWWDCDRKFLDSGYKGLMLPFANQEIRWFADRQTGRC